MGDAQKFDIQGTVTGFPTKKKGDKGLYWNIETSVGKVNLRQDEEPVFQEGKIYRFSGNVSEFKVGEETRKMKWVEEFGVVGESTTLKSQEKTQQTQKTTIHNEPVNQLNGPAMGARMNNVTTIVSAQIKAGIVKGDNDSVLLAMKFWNEIIKRYQETGIVDEVPF